ncbi:MAG TPA: UDPGP type 1 family protein [Phycisphaerae bacterium]|nr:UDPGP type 1 family protein [Phycisphaerae bacterium]
MKDYKSIKEILEKHSQQHLLKFFDELGPDHQQLLLEQLSEIDFDFMDKLTREYVFDKPAVEVPRDMTPPQTIPASPKPGLPLTGIYAQARKLGEKLISEGKVAAFTVAGGQGTRLGYEGPKGCFECTPVVNKPLFRLFAEQIRSASLRFGKTIPWYILTSPTNDTATQAHFRQNDYWAFDPKDIIFVKQGTMPAIGYDGKLLLGRKYRLAVSPDGHGGSLTALRHSGALADMARRGIEYISYFQVDNPLVRAIDPIFIGLHAMNGAEMSAKSLPKREPLEKLGNFCVVDGKTCVIEYSDMPQSLAMACNQDGTLKFSAGSIAIHIFSRAFMEKLTDGGKCMLPFHRADKKVPYVNDAGELVKPENENAVKLEMFVFDAMPLAEKTVIYETRREEEFSPIKNAEGNDSPATCLHDQVRRWASWLDAAGVKIPRDASGLVAAAIEISPLFANSADELADKLKKLGKEITIAPGQNFYLGSKGQIGGA